MRIAVSIFLTFGIGFINLIPAQAGVVDVVVVGSELMVLGSNARDQILIRASRTGGIQVNGLGNTFINQPENKVVVINEYVGSIYADLGGGSDELKCTPYSFDGILRNLDIDLDVEIKCGSGNDLVILHPLMNVSRNVLIEGEAGNDYLWTGADTDGRVTIRGNDGNDFLEAHGIRVLDRLRIEGGNGVDRLKLHHSMITNRSFLRGGPGNDSFLIQHQDSFPAHSDIIADGEGGTDRLELAFSQAFLITMRNIQNPNANFVHDHGLTDAYLRLMAR